MKRGSLFSLPKVIRGHIPPQLVHPRGKRSISPERVPVSQDAKEDFLHKVLAYVAPVRQAHEKPVEFSVMAFKEDPEARYLSVFDLQHQFVVGRFRHRSFVCLLVRLHIPEKVKTNGELFSLENNGLGRNRVALVENFRLFKLVFNLKIRPIMSIKSTVWFFTLVSGSGLLQGQTANEIIKRSEDLVRGESSKGTFKMTVVTPDYSRTIVMDSWWKGDEKALIEIKSPPREAGNKTLKVGNELWMYLRNTETTIKVPPSMMMQSWNGSDFTNDDLVRESSLVEDYKMSIMDHDSVDKAPTWKIELLPKPTAPVVWGRILHWIRKADYLPARTEYYDEKGTLVRTMTYSDYKLFGGRKLPATWKMIDNLEPGEYTEMEYLSLIFDSNISDRVFSFQELERGPRR